MEHDLHVLCLTSDLFSHGTVYVLVPRQHRAENEERAERGVNDAGRRANGVIVGAHSLHDRKAGPDRGPPAAFFDAFGFSRTVIRGDRAPGTRSWGTKFVPRSWGTKFVPQL